jgi:pyruvate dehydrogenase E1 component beta subunit
MKGTLGKILVAEGTEGVKVNTPIAVLVGEGEERLRGSPRRPAAAPKAAALPAAPAARSPRRGDLKPFRSRPRAEWPAESAHPKFPPAPMKTMTVREALRDAMAEEMRRDPTVFLMGEEVGEYQGAYKVPGLAGRIRRQARHRHADHRARLCRHRVGAALAA